MRHPITVNVNSTLYGRINAICGVDEEFRSKQMFLETLVKSYFDSITLGKSNEKILKVKKEEESNFKGRFYAR